MNHEKTAVLTIWNRRGEIMGKRPGNLFSRQRQAALKDTIEADNDRLNNNLKKSSRMKNSTDSLRKMKKRGVIRQMLEKFPKTIPTTTITTTHEHQFHEKTGNNNNHEASGAELIEKTREIENNPDEEEAETEEEEPIYESRKLLIRQMQGMIAKEVLKDRKGTVGSEYDSWSDLEENFARAYEPIPLNIRMETWRQMSKKDILKTISSKDMREHFEGLSRGQILEEIEKMKLSAQHLKERFGIDHLLQHNHPPLTHVQLQRAKQKGRDVDLESIVTPTPNMIAEVWSQVVRYEYEIIIILCLGCGAVVWS